ncbi:AAA family ATPase [Pseudomonas siliginis]|uniref:ATP-binding protein n=1 Tax=Pseudomonas siliginis TaxID=2842346 RepID=A0ABY5CES3_9PSED|nr:AAA family ATPase [Pseudomonas siliginis]UST85760.1 ATP-binding protein [Pseudomonas siliginis]
MIRAFDIENFKSINEVKFELGRINVFIGENGAGKSNILEAIALAGAAAGDKLDNEFLSSRGIRVTSPKLMRAAFEDSNVDPIKIKVMPEHGHSLTFNLQNDGEVYSKWKSYVALGEHLDGDKEKVSPDFDTDMFSASLKDFLENETVSDVDKKSAIDEFAERLKKAFSNSGGADQKKITVEVDISNPLGRIFSRSGAMNVRQPLSGFLIYSPENSALRDFEKEGQIQPLGINGEGLLKLVEVELSARGKEYANQLNAFLSLFGWFKKVRFSSEDVATRYVEVCDRFFTDSIVGLDVKAANEGFLFLLFYFVLFSSDITPQFFAIDNIDASLNPKLCLRLIQELNRLAEANNKQVLLTTHNPAILDGLNLEDDEQRLFVISRGMDGESEIRRIKKPKHIEGAPKLRLSEAFMRGTLGGLPTGF